jgi:hypothetical protein
MHREYKEWAQSLFPWLVKGKRMTLSSFQHYFYCLEKLGLVERAWSLQQFISLSVRRSGGATSRISSLILALLSIIYLSMWVVSF